ncbi:hypothetical protein KIN20_011045, partial [Parelaphostrongylus tenuis]
HVSVIIRTVIDVIVLGLRVHRIALKPVHVRSLPDSPHPAIRSAKDFEVFEKLRRFVPVISSEKNAFKILIDYVSQVMELEQQCDEPPDEKVAPTQPTNPEQNSHGYDDYTHSRDLPKGYSNEGRRGFSHPLHRETRAPGLAIHCNAQVITASMHYPGKSLALHFFESILLPA